MDSTYTHIAILLDRSGSMRSIAEEVVGGLNRYITEQAQADLGRVTVSMVQFDDVYEPLFAPMPIAEVQPLTLETFIPRGWTALRDAVGRTIVTTGDFLRLLPEAHRPARVIFVIVSDGKENASQEYTAQQINYMIETQEKTYNWEFVYLGCKQDAIKEAGEIGIKASHAMTYQESAIGISLAFDSLSRNTKRYREGGVVGMGWTSEDRERQARSK